MVKKFLSSELGKGTFILFVTINIFNFLNFLFHFSLGRLLGPADYGVLVVLMSMVYVFSIPTETVQNVVTRYTAKFNVKKENGKIKYLMHHSLWRVFKISFVLFVIAGVIAIPLGHALRIDFWLIWITNIIIIYAFIEPILRGILQGRKKFGALGASMVLESTFKLVFAVSMVLFGMKVFGAILGVVLGGLASFIFTFYFNKEIYNKKEEKASFDGLMKMSKHYLVSMIVIYVILSFDVILAKSFFSPELAGQYAVLSTLGKIIFFGTFAVSKAMFPLTSENYETKRNTKDLFKKSAFIVTGLCVAATLIFMLFPKLVIFILFGNQYIEMAPYLGYSGLAFSFLSLSNLIIVYGLSVNRIKNSYYLFIFLLIDMMLLFMFHSSIKEYIMAFMVSNIIMFIGTLFLVRGWKKYA